MQDWVPSVGVSVERVDRWADRGVGMGVTVFAVSSNKARAVGFEISRLRAGMYKKHDF